MIYSSGQDLKSINNRAYAKYDTGKAEKIVLALPLVLFHLELTAVFRILQGLTIRKFLLHTTMTMLFPFQRSLQRQCREITKK